jgi:hypothetical protein
MLVPVEADKVSGPDYPPPAVIGHGEGAGGEAAGVETFITVIERGLRMSLRHRKY